MEGLDGVAQLVAGRKVDLAVDPDGRDAVGLAAGSIVGARLGAGLLARIDERLLKIIFGLFLVGVAVLVGVRA